MEDGRIPKVPGVQVSGIRSQNLIQKVKPKTQIPKYS